MINTKESITDESMPEEVRRRVKNAARRLCQAYGCPSEQGAIENELTDEALRARPRYVYRRLSCKQADIARRLKREQWRQRLMQTVDELTLPPRSGDDLKVQCLPPITDQYIRLQLRDSILAHADAFDAAELEVACLWLQGHAPRACFAALGIPAATGYRRYRTLLEQLSEVLKEAR